VSVANVLAIHVELSGVDVVLGLLVVFVGPARYCSSSIVSWLRTLKQRMLSSQIRRSAGTMHPPHLHRVMRSTTTWKVYSSFWSVWQC
jgi:hypothetical protein